MKIAVIGAGISGLVAAYQLRGLAEVQVFEANDYIGGHTHTVDINVEGEQFAVDTGFIVFNDRTYPNFCALLDRLGVRSQKTDMSFGVMDERSGLEYAAPSPRGLFAQPRRVADAGHWRMLRDIPRFNRAALSALSNGHMPGTIGELLDAGAFSARFAEHYLTPMLSAIWSADWDDVRGMPAREFLSFMKNHGLLHMTDRPQWRVIEGGSRNYVEPLVKASRASVHTRAPIQKIVRHADYVEVHPRGAEPLRFDHVVMAVHSDQALRLLTDPTEAEREVLGAIPYQPNEVDLHFYRDILPKARHAWASWNYRIRGDRPGRAGVTYHMNRLQSLCAPVEFCVTLNQRAQIRPGRVLGRYEYAHPVYRTSATRAQARFFEISGAHRTHFCGAYWGRGFHEDGVRSALAACRYFDRGAIA